MNKFHICKQKKRKKAEEEKTKTYITTVFFLNWLIAWIWTYFVCAYHVIGELSAKVVTAFASGWVDYLNDHLF